MKDLKAITVVGLGLLALATAAYFGTQDKPPVEGLSGHPKRKKRRTKKRRK